MTLPDDLLKPISEENPSGEDLHYAPIYDEIKEARRQDDDLSKGVWATERKVADFYLVIKLTQEALATRSKDLQLATWMTEALLKLEGFTGLRQGLETCNGLVDKFWDTVFPALEDGDTELRAAPLEWIGTKLEPSVKSVALNSKGHSWYKYKESRTVGYEAQAQAEAAKKLRNKALAEGKLPPEAFDQSFAETPKAFYFDGEKALDACLKALSDLNKTCGDKFGSSAPSFGQLHTALTEIRHTVHGFLEKKRETEPDPVEEKPQAAPVSAAEEQSDGVPAEADGFKGAAQPAGTWIAARAESEPVGRRDAIAAVASAAAYLRQREPFSPAPYLMMRGLRWGELRAAAAASDQTVMEAPPTEVRQEIKRLALKRKWKELLDMAENVMALPCSRGWLDLQRFVVEACAALGDDYNVIAVAIRSEIRTLLRDLPELLDARLMDDTAVANSETQTWLRGLMQESNSVTPSVQPPAAPVADNHHAAGWEKNFIDSYALAGDALRAGQEQKAFELMFKEVERQRSGRGRFPRRLQLVQLCMTAGKDAIAQPLLDDITAAIDAHKLEEWEDREMIASALATILRSSKKVQADAKEKQKLFERICRLDPVQALAC
jgi:type VI secretion system protein ImpA